MRPFTFPSSSFASRTRGAASSVQPLEPYARQIPASSTAARRFIRTPYLLIRHLSSVILPQEAHESRVDTVEPERYFVPRSPHLVTSGKLTGVFRDAQLIAADLPFARVFSPDIPPDQ